MNIEERLQAMLEKGWRPTLKTHAFTSEARMDDPPWLEREGSRVVRYGWCVDARRSRWPDGVAYLDLADRPDVVEARKRLRWNISGATSPTIEEALADTERVLAETLALEESRG